MVRDVAREQRCGQREISVERVAYIEVVGGFERPVEPEDHPPGDADPVGSTVLPERTPSQQAHAKEGSDQEGLV